MLRAKGHTGDFSREASHIVTLTEALLQRLPKLLAALPGYLNSNFPHIITSQRVDFNRLRGCAGCDEFASAI
jgi:hypothetical protein